MKKVGVLLVYAIIFSFFSSNLYSTPPKITLAIEEGDFSPYTFGSKGPYRGKGAIIDLLKSFEKDIGVEFRFKIYPWKRCLSMLKKNKVDGVFNASFKKERMKFGVYPFVEGKINFMRGTHSSDYVLYKRKNSLLKWDGKKFIDLKNHIGAERGFSIISELKTLGVSVKEVGDASKGLTMTYKGRLQGFVTLESMGDFALFISHSEN